jgi:sialidase-1
MSAELRQKCLAVLRAGLKSEEFWPAMHAAEALTIAGQTTEVRQALEPRLATETDDQRRCGLARELVRAGDTDKAQVMLDILAGEDDYGHVHAAESLYKVAEIGDGRLLRQAMRQNKNPRLQAMAAAALARCGNPQALATIRQLLGSDDAELRKLAAWMLARLGNQTDLAGLRAMTKRESDPISLAYAWFARAALGEAEARRQLQKSLGSDDPAVRTYAAEMAGHSQMPESVETLEKLLDDPVLDVRIRAAQSLFLLIPSGASATD